MSEEQIENAFPHPAKDLGILQSIKQAPEFVASVRQEIKLVERPTLSEVRSTTVMVIVFFCFFVLYFYLLGRIFAPLDRWLSLR